MVSTIKLLDALRDEHELLTEIDSEENLSLKDLLEFRLKLEDLKEKKYKSLMGIRLRNVCLDLSSYWTMRLIEGAGEFISLRSMKEMYSKL